MIIYNPILYIVSFVYLGMLRGCSDIIYIKVYQTYHGDASSETLQTKHTTFYHRGFKTIENINFKGVISSKMNHLISRKRHYCYKYGWRSIEFSNTTSHSS